MLEGHHEDGNLPFACPANSKFGFAREQMESPSHLHHGPCVIQVLSQCMNPRAQQLNQLPRV